jgi:hypothetical protein
MRAELRQERRDVRTAISGKGAEQNTLNPVFTGQWRALMSNDKQDDEEQQQLMSQYGISHETKSVYYFQGYKYDRLADAVRYARDSLSRENATISVSTD